MEVAGRGSARLDAYMKSRKEEPAESYLQSVIDMVWRKDEESLRALEGVYSYVSDPNRSLPVSMETISDAIEEDRKAHELQKEISHYGSTFVKTAFLFMGGKVGVGGAMASFALDQAKPSDPWQTQLLDAGLGAAKGCLLKTAFHGIGAETSIPLRGVALGMATRALDSGLTRQTYLNSTTGEFDLFHGITQAARTTFNGRAALVDGTVFSASAGLLKGIDSFVPGLVARSPLAATMLTGATFGASSGATSELIRQQEAGEQFNLEKVLYRAGVRAAVDAVAAVPGGIQADPVIRTWIKTNARDMYSGLMVESNTISSNLTEQTVAAPTEKGYRVTHTQWGKELYVAKNESELQALKERFANDPNRKLSATIPVDRNGMVSTGDGALVRTTAGDTIVSFGVNREFSVEFTRKDFWDRYERHYSPSGTPGGAFLKLMDTLANPDKPFTVHPRSYGVHSGGTQILLPIVPTSISASRISDFYFNKLPEVRGTLSHPITAADAQR